MKVLKDFMKKNAELVFPRTFIKFQCLEDEKTLEDLGDLMLGILRGALLGRIKFNRDDWQFIVECLWEQRALEIVRGAKWAVMHELCKSSWGGHRPFEGNMGDHFQTKVRKMIRIIIETVPDKEIAQVLREEMSYYDPSGENDRRYMEGRCEWVDVEGTNTMIVSVAGYHSIRRGKVRKGYKVSYKSEKKLSYNEKFRETSKCNAVLRKFPKPTLQLQWAIWFCPPALSKTKLTRSCQYHSRKMVKRKPRTKEDLNQLLCSIKNNVLKFAF